MSYQILPPEIKQYIARDVHRSDVRYAERLGVSVRRRSREDEVDYRTGPREMDTFYRGRGIDNWSRTSKECREMCLSILFGTVGGHRLVEDSFQYELLDTPVVNAINHLVLNGNTTGDKLTLLFFHIVPRLNNLVKITIGHDENIGIEEDFRFDRLLKIAKKITNWTFIDPRYSQMVPLLEANLQDIHTLTIGACDPSEFPFGIISTLPSLANLTLDFERHDVPGRPLIDPRNAALSSLDSCSLRSLTLTAENNRPLDYSVLGLASKFPNLTSLRLSSITFRPPFPAAVPPTPISFTNLRYLELSFSTFTSLRTVLDYASFATLRSLRLTINERASPRDLPDIVQGIELTIYDLLIFQIQKSCPVLDLVIVEAESHESTDSVMLLKMSLDQALRRHRHRQEEEKKHEVGNDSDKEGEDGQSSREVEGEEQGEEEPGGGTADKIERPSISFRTIAEYSRSHVRERVHPRRQDSDRESRDWEKLETSLITADLRRVAEWAVARVDAIERETDVVGTRELQKGMRELQEAMRWMED